MEIVPGITIRSMTAEEFDPLWHGHYDVVFPQRTRFDPREAMSETERQALASLRASFGSPLCLRYGLFEGSRFVGWHVGDQKSPAEFYMRNSGVLPELRRRGLYTALLQHVVTEVTKKGFQLISSRHVAVNNAVIIPKLKLGFVMTGFELSDAFGTLVNLTYFTNPTRRKILGFRAGDVGADDEIRKLLQLTSP